MKTQFNNTRQYGVLSKAVKNLRFSYLDGGRWTRLLSGGYKSSNFIFATRTINETGLFLKTNWIDFRQSPQKDCLNTAKKHERANKTEASFYSNNLNTLKPTCYVLMIARVYEHILELPDTSILRCSNNALCEGSLILTLVLSTSSPLFCACTCRGSKDKQVFKSR